MSVSGLKMSKSGLNMSMSGWEQAENESEWVKNEWKWMGAWFSITHSYFYRKNFYCQFLKVTLMNSY